MNVEQARFNMIEQQIRPWDVSDARVLDAMTRTPREDFVPESLRGLAFSDVAIPLPHGQCMMPPRLEARLLQALNLNGHDIVLEVGTGTGYLTALLARLSRHVYSVDIHPEFREAAAAALARHGIDNVTLDASDAVRGYARAIPFDVIVLTGSVPELDDVWRRSLAIGGRLFAIVGKSPVMQALRVTRTGENDWLSECLFETDFPPLSGVEQGGSFCF